VTELHLAGLLDKVERGFAPHNWDGRRYKSDVSTPRVKRCRDKKRNASLAQGNVSVGVSGNVLETESSLHRRDLAVQTGFEHQIAPSFRARRRASEKPKEPMKTTPSASVTATLNSEGNPSTNHSKT